MADAETLRFYEENAANYSTATSCQSMDFYLVPFANLVPRGGSVVDLGCGSGRDLVSFRRLGFRPIGLDLSKNLAAIATRVSNCPVVIGDLRSLPFVDKSFDAAWASASFLHLEGAELRSALLEVGRIIKPAGVFFSSVKAGEGKSRDADGRLFAYYGKAEWGHFLEQAGFEVVVTEIASQHPKRRDQEKWISSTAKRNAVNTQEWK